MSFIPQNLRYLRKLAELSQQALAEKVGLNRGNIASYEKGVAEPNTKNLLKIVRFFNIDVIDFVEKDLAQLIANNLLEMSPSVESIIFNKSPLSDVIMPLHQFKETTQLSPLDVLAERSASLFSIIQGTRQYYKLIQEDEGNTPGSMKVEEIYMDFMRFLDLASEAQDINHQLFRLLIETRTNAFSKSS